MKNDQKKLQMQHISANTRRRQVGYSRMPNQPDDKTQDRVAKDSEEGRKTICWNREQLARLYGDYLSAVSPINNGKLGVSGAFSIVRQYMPIIKICHVAKAIRHFSHGYTVNFDQFTQMMWFFVDSYYNDENNKYHRKQAEEAILRVLNERIQKQDFPADDSAFYRPLKETPTGSQLADLLKKKLKTKNAEVTGTEIKFLVIPEKLKYLLPEETEKREYYSGSAKETEKRGHDSGSVTIHLKTHIKTLQIKSKDYIKQMIADNAEGVQGKCGFRAKIEVDGHEEHTLTIPASEYVTISDIRIIPIDLEISSDSRNGDLVNTNMLRKINVNITVTSIRDGHESDIGYTKVPLMHVLFAAPYQLDMTSKLVPIHDTSTLDARIMFSISTDKDPIFRYLPPIDLHMREREMEKIVNERKNANLPSILLRYKNRELHTHVYATIKEGMTLKNAWFPADYFLNEELKMIEWHDVGDEIREKMWKKIRSEARILESESICVNSVEFFSKKLSQYERCMLVLSYPGNDDCLVCGNVNMVPFYCIGTLKNNNAELTSVDEDPKEIPEDFLVDTLIVRDAKRNFVTYVNIQSQTCRHRISWNIDAECWSKVECKPENQILKPSNEKLIIDSAWLENL